jgi:hypothetical protein
VPDVQRVQDQHHSGRRPAHTGICPPLFHPRQQHWQDHFAWSLDGTKIEGTTVIGRATVVALRMNHALIVAARRVLDRWIARAAISATIDELLAGRVIEVNSIVPDYACIVLYADQSVSLIDGLTSFMAPAIQDCSLRERGSAAMGARSLNIAARRCVNTGEPRSHDA